VWYHSHRCHSHVHFAIFIYRSDLSDYAILQKEGTAFRFPLNEETDGLSNEYTGEFKDTEKSREVHNKFISHKSCKSSSAMIFGVLKMQCNCNSSSLFSISLRIVRKIWEINARVISRVMRKINHYKLKLGELAERALYPFLISCWISNIRSLRISFTYLALHYCIRPCPNSRQSNENMPHRQSSIAIRRVLHWIGIESTPLKARRKWR